MTISVIFLPTCDLEFMAFGLLAPLDDRPLGLFTSEKENRATALGSLRENHGTSSRFMIDGARA
jgi:hypothetical protein